MSLHARRLLMCWCAQSSVISSARAHVIVQGSLAGTHWDECSSWLTALKRLIKTRQQLG